MNSRTTGASCAARFAAVMAVAGTLLSTPVAAAGNAKVSAGGQYVGEFGPTTVAVHALEKKSGGVTGQFEQHNPAIGLSVHGEVTCLFFVSSNTAIVGGVLTHIQKNEAGQLFPFEEGLPFLLMVRDNGEGSKAAPDVVSPFITDLNLGNDCSNPRVARLFLGDPGLNIPLVHGNAQVKR